MPWTKVVVYGIGGSLSGGRGTLAGGGNMQVIESGCRQIGVAEGARLVVLGAAILAAVWIDQLRQRRMAGAKRRLTATAHECLRSKQAC